MWMVSKKVLSYQNDATWYLLALVIPISWTSTINLYYNRWQMSEFPPSYILMTTSYTR